MSSDSKPSQLQPPTAPLADRMRPPTLEEFLGQTHLLGSEGTLRRLIERDRLPPCIFWGDPGTGKTSLARIIANRSDHALYEISAVSSGVREIRKVIDSASARRKIGQRTLLFIDEIHRFNKAQQDALLHVVEDGTIILIGATTENPSFEVISPLLSRCKVFRFEPLSPEEIGTLIDRAATVDEYLSSLDFDLEAIAREALINYSGGDARTALNGLEVAVELAFADTPPIPPRKAGGGVTASVAPRKAGRVVLSVELIERALMARPGRYDKKGEYHYDVISAFIKSLRGSDPDAAVYWLARMLNAGEDPLFIARRMVILASEDIGNANPTALVLAQACAEAVKFIGLPEAQINLAQTVTYLASSPKSNASYAALLSAQADVAKDPDLPVPLHLRNAVTGLMKEHGYGQNYKYAHEYSGAHADQEHLPKGLEERVYYEPSDRGSEKQIGERLKQWWPKKRRRT